MFKNILTVTNGSERCLHAIEIAADMALIHGANLTVLVASEFRTDIAAAEGYILQPDFDQMRGAAKRREAKHLEQGLEIARKKGIPEAMLTGMSCEEADAATAVLHKANTLGADLIVIGSRGRHGLATLILGSVTADVISGTKIPVLVVK